MNPSDGTGYGHSMYWRYQLKEIALNNGEACSCWKENEPRMNFVGDRKFTIIVKCKEKKSDCKERFDLTQEEITQKFMNFHKV